jgi:hypothetical protein
VWVVEAFSDPDETQESVATPHMRRRVGGKRALPMPDLADHLIDY